MLKVSSAIEQRFIEAVDDIQQSYTSQKAKAIDTMFFDLYNLTANECRIIGFIGIE